MQPCPNTTTISSRRRPTLLLSFALAGALMVTAAGPMPAAHAEPATESPTSASVTLGGVAKAVQIFWGASFSYEKLQAVGGAALALAGELIGITSIKEECFS